mmetsp:Transcript_30421/g.66645  ORF Transcript_30421/g.66645 Transcript_30421/m.66645 type:complete len:149 (+) Transcript_30421:82-528(+)
MLRAVYLLALFALVSHGAELRQLRSKGASAQKWWPLDAVMGRTATPSPSKEASHESPMQVAKDAVILSASFGHQTQAICQEAAPAEQMKCRELAGDRLFCALLKRHAKKYEHLEGIRQERSKCLEIDIMEDSVEAAKDAALEKDAAQG